MGHDVTSITLNSTSILQQREDDNTSSFISKCIDIRQRDRRGRRERTTVQQKAEDLRRSEHQTKKNAITGVKKCGGPALKTIIE